jgi:hypothetical protein
MASKIQLRRDTAANWTSINPILSQGEPGYEIDSRKIKYGNGSSVWNDLPYFKGDTGNLSLDEYTISGDADITVRSGSTEFWKLDLKPDTRGGQQNPILTSVLHDNEGDIVSISVLYEENFIEIVKIGSDGEVLWKKKIIVNGQPIPQFTIDSQNNIFVSDSNIGSNDFSIIKISGADGTIIHQKLFTGSYQGGAFSLTVNSDDNIVASGFTTDTIAEDPDLLIMLIDGSNLSPIWNRVLSKTGVDNILSTRVDQDDNIISVGQYERLSSPIKKEMIVTKYSKYGIFQWAKTIQIPDAFGVPYTEAYEFATDLTIDAIGNIFVVGNFTLKDNGYHNYTAAFLVFKMDSSGTIEWARNLFGYCEDFVTSIALDSSGNLYIAAITWGESSPGLVISKTDSSGNILWQRNLIDPSGTWTSSNPLGGDLGGLISVYEDKIAFAGNYINFASTSDGENQRSFVASLPTDGREVKLGAYKFLKNRIPSKFIVLNESNISFSDWSQVTVDVSDGSYFAGVTDSSLSTEIVRTSTNDLVVNGNGNLEIPTDSNLKLKKTQIGFISVYGEVYNNNDDIGELAVVTDIDGNSYTIGKDYTQNNPLFITKRLEGNGRTIWRNNLRSGSGARFTVSVSGDNYVLDSIDYRGSHYELGEKIFISGGDLGGSQPDNNLTLVVAGLTGGTGGRVGAAEVFSGTAATGASGPYTNVQDYYDSVNTDYGGGIAIDPITKNLWVVTGLASIQGDDDDPFWSKLGLFEISSTIGTILSSKEIIGIGDLKPRSIKVTSTSKPVIVGQINNQYQEFGEITPLAGSTGGIIQINKSDITDSSPTVYPGDGLPGDWYIYGTDINVKSIITDVNLYTGLTGAGATGAGAIFTIIVDPISGAYSVDNYENVGYDYVIGDKITIPGEFLGGSTPDNNLVLNVESVDSGNSNSINSVSVYSGTGSTDQLRLMVSQSSNFGGAGTWYIKKSLQSEAFIWTPDWEKSIGGPGNYDRFYDVAIDSSNNIYAVGRKTIDNNGQTQAMVVKFNSAGVIQWSKNINTQLPTTQVERATSVCIDNTGKIIVGSVDDGNAVLTKLDPSGNVLWQTHTTADYGFDPAVAVDTDGKIIMAVGDNDGNNNRIYILKFDTNGVNIWRRKIVSKRADYLGSDDGFNSCSLSVANGKYNIVGTTYTPADYYGNTFFAQFPVDGTGLGTHGYWSYESTDDIEFSHPEIVSENIELTVINTSLSQSSPTGYYMGNSYDAPENVYNVNVSYGGSIEFSDGSTQDRSAIDIPQNYIAYDYTITPDDRGKHLYVNYSGATIYVPYTYYGPFEDLRFPIGSVVTIVNRSGGTIYIYPENNNNDYADIFCAGSPTQNNAWYLENYGVATLLKTGYNEWMLSGATLGDDI